MARLRTVSLVVLGVAAVIFGGTFALRLVRGPAADSGSNVATLASPSVLGSPLASAAASPAAGASNAAESPAASSTDASSSDAAASGAPASAELASPAPTPTPTESPTPIADSLITARPLPTPVPAQTGAINYLRTTRGAIVRAWTPRVHYGYPRTPLDEQAWEPPVPGPASTSAPPPYTFVFEFPTVTTIDHLLAAGTATLENAPSPNPSDASATPIPGATVKFAISTTSTDAGFTDVGSVSFGADASPPPQLALASPAQARWLRITIDAPAKARLSLADLGAFGTQLPLPAPQLDGAWYDANVSTDDSPWIDAAHGRLLDRADPERIAKASLQIYGAIHDGAYGQFARCGGGGASSVFATYDDGSHIMGTRHGIEQSSDGAMIAIGSGAFVVGVPQSATSFYYRAPIARPCAEMTPVGHGPLRVGVLTRQPDFSSAYVPATEPSAFPRYRFSPIFAPLMRANDLAGLDTLVFGSSCDIGRELQPWQAQPILDFVAAGHKLIVHDADSCSQANYSFLPYPLALNPTGAQGAKGSRLLLIENDPLGTDSTDRSHYIDLTAFVKNQFQQIGDGDVIVTDDRHWCGHLLTTNVNGFSGYVQAYAHDGKGLIVYDGLDHDNYEVPQYQQLIKYELDLPLNANLPCAHAIGGFTLVPERQRHEYVPGKAQPIGVDLQALAIMTYSGEIDLTVQGPYPAALSPAHLSLKSNLSPFGLVVQVPKDARGLHRFTITGTDASGRRARAFVELAPGKITALEKTLQDTGRITLHNILFDTASAKLRAESYAVLTQIADALGRNRGWRLSIQGHTDSDGGAAYNLDLSQRRAASVKNALVTNFHVDPKRLQTKGFGLTRPVASNTTDAGKQLNRRVELVRI